MQIKSLGNVGTLYGFLECREQQLRGHEKSAPLGALCRLARFGHQSVHRCGDERRDENQHRRHQKSRPGGSGSVVDQCLGSAAYLETYPLLQEYGEGISRIEVLRARTVGAQHRSWSFLELGRSRRLAALFCPLSNILGTSPMLSVTCLMIACGNPEPGDLRQAQQQQGFTPRSAPAPRRRWTAA